MNITVQRGEIQNKEDEAIVVNLFEGARPGGASKAVDQAQLAACMTLANTLLNLDEFVVVE